METAIFIAVGYLAGSLPFSFWIARYAKGIDLRKVGSGNIGASNVWRACGPGYGVLAVFLDMAKGFVPTLVAIHSAGDTTAVLTGAAAMAGHWRPLFLGFSKGGKMVATAGGVVFALAPLVAVLDLVVWLVVALLAKYSSETVRRTKSAPAIASVVVAATTPIAAIFLSGSAPIIAFCFVGSAGVIWLHRSNFQRLRRGPAPATP